MNQDHKPHHTRSQLIQGAILIALLGAVVGAIIGWGFGGTTHIIIGAAVTALYMSVAETCTNIRRKPAELKPLWSRIIASGLFGAMFAVLIDAVFTPSPLVLSSILGILAGLFGFGPRKFVLGIAIGVGFGVAADAIFTIINPAVVGAAVALIYRILAVMLFPETSAIEIMTEQVPAADVKYVVPFEAYAPYVGTEYMKLLSEKMQGHFQRNPEGIGLIDDFNLLRGAQFDPAKVDPCIRDFYEHTSNYKLTIVPKWNPLMILPFWLFKTYIARPIGQANLPFNMREIQRGVVSYIDRVDYPQNDGHIQTLRAWIRAFEETQEAIYIGIYTVVRHQGVGYVSVGFPLPESNFSVTLLPYNHRETGLLLKTRDTGMDFPGHYLSEMTRHDGTLSTFRLRTMDEEIDVFMAGNQLKTEHRFYLGGMKILTLDYTILARTDKM